MNTLMQVLLARLVEAGCKVRTVHEIPARIIIFDRAVAFLARRCAQKGASVIRDPGVVDFLHRWLEQIWASAVPLGAAMDPGYGAAADDLKQVVVRLLANGEKDELIARRLNISVRTCRRHVAEIMTDLEASSRFQAGVLAARCGLLDGPAR